MYSADDYDEALALGDMELANHIKSSLAQPLEQQQRDDPYGANMFRLHQAPWYERALVGAGHRADQMWQGLKKANTYLDQAMAPGDEGEKAALERMQLQEDDDATAKYRKDIEKNAGVPGVLGELAPYYVSGAATGPAFSALTENLFGGLNYLANAPFTAARKKAFDLMRAQRPLMPGLPLGKRVANIVGSGLTGLMEGGLDSEKNTQVSGLQGLAGGVAAEMARPVLSRVIPNNTQQDRDILDWASKNYGYQPTPGELTKLKSVGVYDAKLRTDAKTQDLMQNFDLHNDAAVTNMMADVLGLPKTGTLTKQGFANLKTEFDEGFDTIRKQTYGEFTPEHLAQINAYATGVQNNPGLPQAIKDQAEMYRNAMQGLSGPGGNLMSMPITDATRMQIAKNLQGVWRNQVGKNQSLLTSVNNFAKSPQTVSLRNNAFNAEQTYDKYLSGRMPFELTDEAPALWQAHSKAIADWEAAAGQPPEVLMPLAKKARDTEADYLRAQAAYTDELKAPDLSVTPRAALYKQQHDAAAAALQDHLASAPTVNPGDITKQEKWVKARLADINSKVGYNRSQTNQGFLTPAHLAVIDKHLMNIKNAGIEPHTKNEFYPEGFYDDVYQALAPIREGMRQTNEAGNTIVQGTKVNALDKEISKSIRDYYTRGEGAYAQALQPFKDHLNKATKWEADTPPEVIDELTKLKERYAMYDLVKDNRMINADLQVDPTAITKWAEGDKWELDSLLSGSADKRLKENLQNMAYLHRYKLQMPRTNQTRNIGSLDVDADTAHTPWRTMPSLSTQARTQLYLRGLPPIIPRGWPNATGLLNLPNKGLMSVQPWFHATEQTQNFGGRTADWLDETSEDIKKKYRKFMKD
jgi:hypothetical protein